MKKQHSLKRLLLLSGVAAIMCTSCIFLPPKEEVEVVKKDGMTCVWQDEFNYEGKPDTSKWKYETGKWGWGNNELQNYVDNSTKADTAIVGDGYLKIKAYYDESKSEWKSARMNSKQSWKYGYIEARLKVTNRVGAWPAFWMMPQDSDYGRWPASGEIDIMENAPATFGQNVVFSTLHANGHYSTAGQGIGKKSYSNLSSAWHTFGIKWTEEKITAYYDDVSVGEYVNNGSGYNDWPYDKNFFIILNLAIGGDLGGNISQVNSLGGNAEFLVDYVRVYQ